MFNGLNSSIAVEAAHVDIDIRRWEIEEQRRCSVSVWEEHTDVASLLMQRQKQHLRVLLVACKDRSA